MTGTAWRQSRRGGDPASGGVVLAVDFGPRTGQRGFGRLAERLGLPQALFETVPLKVSGTTLAAAAAPERYVRRWTEDLPVGRIRGIIAFCSGARFTGALAKATAHEGVRPTVIFLDPSDITGESLRVEFEAAIESLRSQVGDAAIESARREAATVAATGDDLASIAEALCVGQRRLVDAALSGAPRHLVDGLCERFATYLGYLAASGLATDVAVEPALVLATADHPLPDRYRKSALVLDLAHERMLDDDAVAALVRERLAASTVEPNTPVPAPRDESLVADRGGAR